MKRLEWNDRVKSEWFGSWGEFVDAAESRADQSIPVARGALAKSGKHDWDFGVGFGGALKLARRGWSDGLVKVRELSAVLERSVDGHVQGRRLEYDVAGDWFDVGRVVAGDPECGVNVRRARVLGPVVRVVVTGGANGSTSGDDIYRRGACVVALVDVLEGQGIRCEVVLGFCNAPMGHGSRRSMHGVALKSSEDALDLDRLAFALCHPATLRRLSFAIREGLPTEWRRAFEFGVGGYGYGVSESYPAGGNADDVVALPAIGRHDRVWGSDEKMLEWLKREAGRFVTIDN